MHAHRNERREIEEERERCCCAGLAWIFQFSCSKHRSHSTPVRITAFGQPFCTLLFPSSSHCFIIIPFAAVISRGCSPWCSCPPPQGMPVLGWRVWFRGMKPPPAILTDLWCSVLPSLIRDPSFKVQKPFPVQLPGCNPTQWVWSQNHGMALGWKGWPHAGTCLSASLLLEWCKEAIRAG